MLNRWTEDDSLQETCKELGAGVICFSPLAQGLLTDRYLNGIPEDSRAKRNLFLQEKQITEEVLSVVSSLNEIASQRGQTLAEMALAWVLRKNKVTSVLVGASRPSQILDSVKCIQNLSFTDSELSEIDSILARTK